MLIEVNMLQELSKTLKIPTRKMEPTKTFNLTFTLTLILLLTSFILIFTIVTLFTFMYRMLMITIFIVKPTVKHHQMHNVLRTGL